MSEANRVFITGRGALTASGESAEATWQAIVDGRSGIAEIDQWDLSGWPTRLGGEIKNLQPAKLLPDRKLMKVISRQDAIGINAAIQAVTDSQLEEYRHTLTAVEAFNDATAVYVGSPGNKYYQEYDFLPLVAQSQGDMQVFAQHLFTEVHPMWLLRSLPNNVLAYTGITYNFKGPNQNIVNHAVSGTQAIIEAYHAIRCGLAERAVVVAYDLGMEPQGLFYYDKLGVLSQRHLKPFDAAHDGTVLAEGAAALILESETSALARGATCYAEVLGGLSASEKMGLFDLQAEGQALAQLFEKLLKNNNLSSEDIGLVVAHGNGNPKSDISEAAALKAVFGDQQVPVTAFKWSTGHTLCASGVLDVVLSTFALSAKLIPGIANFESPAQNCQLAIQKAHRTWQADNAHVLLVSRGYGSMNAAVVLKHCDANAN